MPPPPPPAHLNHHLVDPERHQPLSGTNHKPPIFLINTILPHCLIICTVKSPLDSHEKYWERLDYSVTSRTGKRCEREREIFSSQEKEKNYFNPSLLPLTAGAEYMNTDKISQLWVHIPKTSALSHWQGLPGPRVNFRSFYVSTLYSTLYATTYMNWTSYRWIMNMKMTELHIYF